MCVCTADLLLSLSQWKMWPSRLLSVESLTLQLHTAVSGCIYGKLDAVCCESWQILLSPSRDPWEHSLYFPHANVTHTFSLVTQLASPLCRQALPSTQILTDVSIILETLGEAWLLLFNFKGTKWTSHKVSALSFCEPLFQQGVFFLVQHYGALSPYLCANCLDCWRWNGLLLRHFGHEWFFFYVLHHQPSCCHCI